MSFLEKIMYSSYYSNIRKSNILHITYHDTHQKNNILLLVKVLLKKISYFWDMTFWHPRAFNRIIVDCSSTMSYSRKSYSDVIWRYYHILRYYSIIFIVGYIYNIRIMYYVRIIQEDIVTLPVGIREGIIRGNGYVLNMKYWIYIITSYLYISYCCNVYLNYNLFVYTSYTNAYIVFSMYVSSCLYQQAYYIYMTIDSCIVQSCIAILICIQ